MNRIFTHTCIFFILIITVFIENAYAFEKESRPEKKAEPIMHEGKPLNDESWHYYVDKELLPEEEIILPPPPPPAVSSGKGSEQKPEAFSVEWFKQNIAIIQARAMDNPNDKDAVRAHLYAQKVMLDKAELFAHQVSYQQSIDPNLQEGVRVPIVGAARTMNLMQRSEHREEAVDEDGSISSYVASSTAKPTVANLEMTRAISTLEGDIFFHYILPAMTFYASFLVIGMYS